MTMFSFLHGTTVGAWMLFVLLLIPWVAGVPMMLSPLLLVTGGFPILGTAILGMFLTQYVWPLKTWPAFRKMIRDFDGRVFYKSCELTLVDGVDLRDKSSMLCYHPHGILCAGFGSTGTHNPEFAEGRHGDVSWLISGALCNMPFFKLIVKWMGNIFAADKPEMTRLMKQGKNVAIIPGGFQEATIMKQGAERVWLKDRVGFVVYALKYGYRVHPCYTFGESDTFWCPQALLKFRLKLNDLGLPGVLPGITVFGDWRFPMFAKANTEIHTFVGKPLEFPRIEKPTKADVSKYHGLYMDALKALFDANKAATGRPDAQLEIW